MNIKTFIKFIIDVLGRQMYDRFVCTILIMFGYV